MSNSTSDVITFGETEISKHQLP